MMTLIPKSTKFPDKGKTKFFSKTFIPTKNYSKGYIVNIFEGESEFVIDNHLLGKFTVVGIPYNAKKKQLLKLIFILIMIRFLLLLLKLMMLKIKKL